MVSTRSQTRASAPQAAGETPRAGDEDPPEIVLPTIETTSLVTISSRAAATARPKQSKGTVEGPSSESDDDDDLPRRKHGSKAKAAKSQTSSKASLTKRVAEKKAKIPGDKGSKGKAKHGGTDPQFFSSNATDGQPKTILDLPAELRNDIWTMLLVQDGSIPISPIRPFVKEPALLAVNRQVRSETMSIWYAENAFEMMGSSPAVKFLRSRNDQQLRSMRTLYITSEKSDQMKQTPRVWLEHLRKKTEMLMREFEPRGFRRKALRFQVIADGTMKWINGDDELQNFEAAGPADKGKKIRGGPRKGEKVAGAGGKDDIAD